MKTLKTGDKVTITKAGIVNGATGNIISINDMADRPLCVELDGVGMKHWFKYMEVSTGENNAPTVLKSSETTQQINTDELTTAKIKAISKMGVKNVAASLEKSEPKKRGRKPKGEVKPIVQKRKYTKKPKS